MNKDKMVYFKKKLLKEREKVNKLISDIKEYDNVNSNVEFSSELSFYDNHPSDLASEMNDLERGMALKEHEVSIIKKIDDAISDINEGNYGICKSCGKEISSERLDFVPYAQYCVECQNNLNSKASSDKGNRPIEESVLENPFGYGYNDYSVNEDIEFDAEDSYQGVERFNKLKNIYEYYDEDEEYVEPIEKISNEQYKNSLPD